MTIDGGDSTMEPIRYTSHSESFRGQQSRTVDYVPFIKSQPARTRLTLGPYVVQFWSRGISESRETKPLKSTVRQSDMYGQVWNPPHPMAGKAPFAPNVFRETGATPNVFRETGATLSRPVTPQSPEYWLKTRPESGLHCLARAESTQQRTNEKGHWVGGERTMELSN